MARFCYTVMETIVNDKGEYTPIIVRENESGYYRTDWSWGKDFKVAEQIAKQKNDALGLTDDEVDNLIITSMRRK